MPAITRPARPPPLPFATGTARPTSTADAATRSPCTVGRGTRVGTAACGSSPSPWGAPAAPWAPNMCNREGPASCPSMFLTIRTPLPITCPPLYKGVARAFTPDGRPWVTTTRDGRRPIPAEFRPISVLTGGPYRIRFRPATLSPGPGAPTVLTLPQTRGMDTSTGNTSTSAPILAPLASRQPRR